MKKSCYSLDCAKVEETCNQEEIMESCNVCSSGLADNIRVRICSKGRGEKIWVTHRGRTYNKGTRLITLGPYYNNFSARLEAIERD
jgi:hypothetical protein